jgi:hypothetical protein
MTVQKHRFTSCLTAIGGSWLALTAASVTAQTPFPARNVQVIVPYPAGGSIDVIARAVAIRLTEQWGRNVVVDNRPGASGMIGTELAIRADADGHTLLAHTSSYPATAAVREKLPFDPARAIVPVGMFARAPMILAVHPSVPAKNVRELVALAKKNPGTLNYSSSGTGGNNHFSGALFAAAVGVKMTHIPYKGIAPAVTALAAGEVELVIASAAAVNPQLRANRIRALAVTSAEPTALLPGLPAIAQSGVPGYAYELWWGMFAAAGISAERAGIINSAINKALASPEMKNFLEGESADVWIVPASQFAELLPKEIERYRKAAALAGVTAQ